MICKIDNEQHSRKEVIKKLSLYKNVDCGGEFLNNIGMTVPRDQKIEFNLPYKFSLAFENKKYPGYVTEKMIDIYTSHCIPIFWGCDEVAMDFNPMTFINANQFNRIEELVDYIIQVDNNDDLYQSYFNDPIFSTYWLNTFLHFDMYFFPIVEKIINE